MKKQYIIKIFTILFFILPYVINFSIEDLNNPRLFEDEICSYNGAPDETLSNSTWVNCTCQEEYTNDFSKNRSINGVPVQCGYEKKRRFIALFLSVFLPFGVDYLYLGHYWLFVLIFFACWFTLIGNCVRFAVTSHKDYLKNEMNLFFVIMAILMLIWWILNVVLIWTGIITDGNGIKTVDDLYYLIKINN
jgi:hypothetical protein